MFKIQKTDLELILGKKIKDNISVLGIDVATEAGYCIGTSKNGEVTLDYNYIKFPKDDSFGTYQEMAQFFKGIIKSNYYVVIEDSYYSKNFKTFKVLSRFGGILVGICEMNDVEGYTFKTPSHIRAQVGLHMREAKKGEAKKYIRKWVKDNLDLDIENDNCSDGLLLSLYGLIDHTETKKKKARKNTKKKITTKKKVIKKKVVRKKPTKKAVKTRKKK